MAEEFVIAPAPPGFDRWDELLALLHRAFAAHAGRIDPPSSSTRDTPDGLRTMAANGRLNLATSADGALAGCVFARADGDSCYLFKLAVDPPFQGRGIGRRLVQAVIDDARRAGFLRVTLGVRIALAENIALFERLGFVRVGETCHPGYTVPTSLNMALTL
jgi:ribosomal protein S18 acetylase RimI-like enzyme